MAIFIAICDDEKGISAALENVLIGMLTDMNIQYEIDVYFAGEQLCAKMESGTHYDLIFLDIEFAQDAINGIEVGRLIRETYNNNTASIVYMSWKMKYSMQLFDIRPFHFLLKPLGYEKVEQVIKTYLSIAGLFGKNFIYKIGHSTHKLPVKDIVYLQSDKRKLTIHLSDGREEEFYGTLSEVYKEQLQSLDFLFIHTSYVVNYDYIKTVKYKEVILTTGDLPLSISRTKRAEIRETYCAIMNRRRV